MLDAAVLRAWGAPVSRSVARPVPRACEHAAARMPDGSCLLCDARRADPIVPPPDSRLSSYTPEQLQRAALNASAERMRRSLGLFVARGWHVTEPDVPLEWEWYHDALCGHIQAMLEDWIAKRADPVNFVQRIRNLCVNMPPGTLKSRILMVYAVAWMWLRCPTWKVLCISSNPENVTRDAELCRDLVGSAWFTQTFGVHWKVREDIDSKKKYKLTAGGERLARGMLAKFTGLRADAIFLDDPDDAHDVFSEASRKERASKWENAIFNRVNDKRCSIRIGLQQRVHEDDWSAQVLRQGTWVHLDVPQEITTRPCECKACDVGRKLTPPTPRAEGDDRVYTPIGWSDPRKAPGWARGPLLHPERFTPEDLAEERTRLGNYGYECQHNQRPSSLEGGMFARGCLRFFRIADDFAGDSPRPEGCVRKETHPAIVLTRSNGRLYVDGEPLEEVCLSVDASHGSLSSTASRSALTVIGIKGSLRFVLHDSTRVRTFTQTLEDIRTLREAWHCTRVLVENKANGRPVLEILQDEVDGLKEFDPKDGSKESRASAMMPAWDAGQILLLEGAPWLDDWVSELCIFNHGKHDDRVDAVSQCLAFYKAKEPILRKWRKFAIAKTLVQARRD